MRPSLRLGLLALLLAFGAAACKKPPPPPRPTPTPTPTPVPATDVIGFMHMGQIWATNWNGTQTRVVADAGRGKGLWFPSESPDGTHFLAWLSRSDGSQDVARVDLTGRVTVLTEIGERADPAMKNLRLGNAPAYSPDGTRIAYAFNGNIWMMDATGFNAETLIGDGASWSPAFSPDGKTLAYVNGTRGKYDLWVTDLDSRDTWQLTDFAAFSVGHPRWNKDGKHIMITRSQGDESDVVQVLATTDTPLADADLLTRDKASSSGVFGPAYLHILFSNIGEDGHARLMVSDATGAGAKSIGPDDALSPAWMRPATQTAMAFDAAPSRPTPVRAAAAPTATPVPAQPTPTAVTAAAAPAAPAKAPAAPTQAAVPAAPPAPAAKPAAEAKAAPAAPAKPAAPAAQATAAAPTRPAPGAQASAPKPSTVPTQPPLKAAPLRLRYKADFNDDESLSPASMADLRKLGKRVQQYDSSKVEVIGPLDGSALRGRYPSAEARSRARAQSVAKALAASSGLDAAKVQAQPYAPATAGAGAVNSIQIYVEMK